MLKILLVEDDDNLANGIRYALEQEGWSVAVAGSVSNATDLYRSQPFHLILLDVMLPDGNGLDLCRDIRESSDIPIVFLTARDEEVDVVMGLESGGDDYITKPFRLRELISRIKANVRKHGREATETGPRVIRSGGITLSMTDFRVYKKGNEIPLTPTEFRILKTLMQNPGVLLARKRILESVWDIDGDFIDDNTLSVHIRKLREKLEDTPSEPGLIKTVRRLGYRWSGDGE